MKSLIKWFTNNLSWLVLACVGALCAIFILTGTKNEEGFITVGGKVTIEDSTKEFIEQAKIEYGSYVKALMTVDGKDVEIDAPTVESIDSIKILEDTFSGLGLYAPVSSATAFKDFALGKCFDVDGYAGAQCWDLGALFWTNYTGRSLNTCGTGAAKGTIQDGCWQKNAGDEFVMVWNPREIQAGDWVVFTYGQYGHIGMALGGYNNGYVTLLGQNQGRAACASGGMVTSIININLKDFGGAFRPKDYVVIEPEIPTQMSVPEPEPLPLVPDTGIGR